MESTNKTRNNSLNNNYKFQADSEGAVKDLNKVLRGEISAVEAYKQVTTKFSGEPFNQTLKSIMSEHQNTVEDLKRQINFKPTDESPDKDSGVWGTFVASFVGTAKTLGEKAALKALQEGEEHGLNQYNDMLKDKELSAQDKDLIRSEYIPRQEKHISQLKSLMN